MSFVATDGTVCATESERFWYEENRNIAPPQREMSADAIAENGTCFATEDDENWIITFYDSREPSQYRPKDIEPYCPLALVMKWGFRAVNVERLKELEKQLLTKPKPWQRRT